jgi:methylenetetrahydrofolate dehydrogenase (NADP+) / methenyltetrahydrofolate cyclohydrolase
MNARILDGRSVGAQIRREALDESTVFRKRAGRPPGLRVFLIGDDPGSAVYVRNKENAAREAAIAAETVRLAEISESALIERIQSSNQDLAIDGILVQMPLPSGIDTRRILDAIAPEKDVDGLHPINTGLLWQGRPKLAPCTPAGIIELLRRSEIEIAGRRAVVVGRSGIVGKPLAALLLSAHATVTICHSKTPDLASICREADLLVAAVGRPRLIGAEHVKRGAVVIDVGMNRTAEGLCGDVDTERAGELASAITPVPGGVGPLTVAMLMKNTVRAAILRAEPPAPQC